MFFGDSKEDGIESVNKREMYQYRNQHLITRYLENVDKLRNNEMLRTDIPQCIRDMERDNEDGSLSEEIKYMKDFYDTEIEITKNNNSSILIDGEAKQKLDKEYQKLKKKLLIAEQKFERTGSYQDVRFIEFQIKKLRLKFAGLVSDIPSKVRSKLKPFEKQPRSPWFYKSTKVRFRQGNQDSIKFREDDPPTHLAFDNLPKRQQIDEFGEYDDETDDYNDETDDYDDETDDYDEPVKKQTGLNPWGGKSRRRKRKCKKSKKIRKKKRTKTSRQIYRTLRKKILIT
jgi:hypothetical protein